MTNKFKRALSYVLANEGGDSNHPRDHGGKTRWGITAKTSARHGYDIQSLTYEQAVSIYHKEYWAYDWISDDVLATKVLDLAVNMGNRAANKLLQGSANDCGMCLDIDGLIGHNTRLAVNALQPEAILPKLVSRAKQRYAEIVASDPTQKVFENGWMARAERLPGYEKEVMA